MLLGVRGLYTAGEPFLWGKACICDPDPLAQPMVDTGGGGKACICDPGPPAALLDGNETEG